jgi:hypothetical protein
MFFKMRFLVFEDMDMAVTIPHLIILFKFEEIKILEIILYGIPII